MSRYFFMFAFAVCLAGCSQSNSTPKPAESDGAKAPAQESGSQPATAQAVRPESTPPPPATADPAVERPTPVEAPATPEKAAPPDTPSAGASTGPRPAAGEKPRTAEAPEAAPSTPSAAEKAAAETPQLREVTIPSGTALGVTLRTSVASDTSHIEDEVRGTLTKAIVIGGVTAVPAGTEVVGTVRGARRSGRVKGRASIAMQFERLIVRGEPLAIRTATVSRLAAVKRREDVKKGAIGAAAGAIIGGLAGGGKGAAIGAGVGGTGAVVATRGEEVRLAAGTVVRTTLQQPLRVVVPGTNDR